MPKVPYDISTSDPKRARGGASVQPKPGWYDAKISSIEVRKDKKDLVIIYEVTKGKYKGAKVYDYISYVNEAVAWKMDQFLQAIGVVDDSKKRKNKGSLDTKEAEGTEVKLRVRGDTYNEEYRAKAGAVAAAGTEEEDEDEDESDDIDDDEVEDDDEDSDDEESDGDDDDEVEDEDEDDDDEDEDEDEEEDDEDEDLDEEEEEEEKPKKKKSPAKKSPAKKASPKPKAKPEVKKAAKGKGKKKLPF